MPIEKRKIQKVKKALKRILIIDDDPNVVGLLHQWLVVAHYEVASALNGQVGLEKAKELKPDLILSDLMLPDIGGTEIARRIKADRATKNIPIIFISVVMGLELDKGDETIEIDGCLYRIFAKPLHNPKLLAEIRKSINRRIYGNKFFIEGS